MSKPESTFLEEPLPDNVREFLRLWYQTTLRALDKKRQGRKEEAEQRKAE